MTINVNHHPKHIKNNATVQELIEELSIKATGIAIAINNQVVQKDIWHLQPLQENDQVTIIQATQGG